MEKPHAHLHTYRQIHIHIHTCASCVKPKVCLVENVKFCFLKNTRTNQSREHNCIFAYKYKHMYVHLLFLCSLSKTVKLSLVHCNCHKSQIPTVAIFVFANDHLLLNLHRRTLEQICIHTQNYDLYYILISYVYTYSPASLEPLGFHVKLAA